MPHSLPSSLLRRSPGRTACARSPCSRSRLRCCAAGGRHQTLAGQPPCSRAARCTLGLAPRRRARKLVNRLARRRPCTVWHALAHVRAAGLQLLPHILPHSGPHTISSPRAHGRGTPPAAAPSPVVGAAARRGCPGPALADPGNSAPGRAACAHGLGGGALCTARAAAAPDLRLLCPKGLAGASPRACAPLSFSPPATQGPCLPPPPRLHSEGRKHSCLIPPCLSPGHPLPQARLPPPSPKQHLSSTGARGCMHACLMAPRLLQRYPAGGIPVAACVHTGHRHLACAWLRLGGEPSGRLPRILPRPGCAALFPGVPNPWWDCGRASMAIVCTGKAPHPPFRPARGAARQLPPCASPPRARVCPSRADCGAMQAMQLPARAASLKESLCRACLGAQCLGPHDDAPCPWPPRGGGPTNSGGRTAPGALHTHWGQGGAYALCSLSDYPPAPSHHRALWLGP